jgi:E3 ubiquitin-protein ligase SHPRH
MSDSTPVALSLPATSQCQVRLKKSDYDLAQLHPALEAALTGTLHDPEPGELVAADPQLTFAVADNFCHIHTLTVPAFLEVPPTHFEYPSGRRVNPDRTVYDALANNLQGATEAGMPVPLSLPSKDCIHLPFDFLSLQKDKRDRALQRSPDVFLPGARKALVKLPAVHGFAGRTFFANATAWDSVHWLHAALALDPLQKPTRKGVYRDDVMRVALRTGVQIVWFPGPTDESDVELRLLITVDAYLNMDALDGPRLPDVGASMFNVFLATALPSDADTGSRDTVESWLAARAAALKGFYDSLGPAPDHPYSFDARKLQPVELACKLLPFQTRTVRLLLEREGAPMCGDVFPREPQGQWSRIHFDNFGDYAFRRLSAELRPIATDPKGKGRETSPGVDPGLAGLHSLFNLSKVCGTMLCEEMGKSAPGGRFELTARSWQDC